MNEILAKLNKPAAGDQYGEPTGKIRIANLAGIDGKPLGPAPSGLNNCNGRTPVATSTSTTTVSAGQRCIVFIYGLPGDGYKTLTSPIARS